MKKLSYVTETGEIFNKNDILQVVLDDDTTIIGKAVVVYPNTIKGI